MTLNLLQFTDILIILFFEGNYSEEKVYVVLVIIICEEIFITDIFYLSEVKL